MDNNQRVKNFNKQLDSLLSGLSWSSKELSSEDRRALLLARDMTQLDLSGQSKVQETLRQCLKEKATRQLPSTRKLSINLLFRPRQVTWIVLIVSVQLIIGLIFGDMIAQLVFTPQPAVKTYTTPPVSTSLIQRPLIDEFNRNASMNQNSEWQQTELFVYPIPTPAAPLSKEESLRTTVLPALAFSNNPVTIKP